VTDHGVSFLVWWRSVCSSLNEANSVQKLHKCIYIFTKYITMQAIIWKSVFRRRPRVEVDRQVMKVKHRTEVYTYFHSGMRTAYTFVLFDTDSTLLNTLQVQRSLTFSDKLVLINSVPTPPSNLSLVTGCPDSVFMVFLFSRVSLNGPRTFPPRFCSFVFSPRPVLHNLRNIIQRC